MVEGSGEFVETSGGAAACWNQIVDGNVENVGSLVQAVLCELRLHLSGDSCPIGQSLKNERAFLRTDGLKKQSGQESLPALRLPCLHGREWLCKFTFQKTWTW